MADTRTKRQKLMEMAARGTPHEAEIARRKLESMTDPEIEAVMPNDVPTQAQMMTFFGRAMPFGEFRKTIRLASQDLTFTDPGPFDE
jgi:hypothetical protein